VAWQLEQRFTSGWNAAVFYSIKFARGPPMLRHNIMNDKLLSQRNSAIAELGKSEDIAIMYT